MSHEPDRRVQLRRDLEHSYQEQQGKSYLVVKDPVTRRYFRFTESQAAIIELFKDAPEDIDTVAAHASELLHAVVTTTTIEAFCKSLDEKFLLETPEVREKLAAIKGQQLQGRNFLYWKIASVNPERIFAWLLPRTRWAYTHGFQVFALLTIFTGFTIAYLNWGSLKGAAPGLFNVYGLLLIWPVVFTVTTIHEFSHGLTCCHYGGKVHEVGFMLIYFSPAFYCDVSDSYMFPKRTNRMAVALAGGYAQLTIWGICTMIWRITDSDAWVNQLALIVVVFSGLQTLLNFNPLIKLDGYYILSDFLEVPNLRAKALRSFWDWIAGNGKSRWSYREKRAQLVYGAAAAAFSISLLVYVYAALYTWATSKYELAGLVVFGIFANFTLRKALVEPMEGVKAVAARASMKRYRNIGILVVALILSVVMYWPLKINAGFKIIPKAQSSVRAATAGVVVDIPVRENSVVHKGDVLARMTDFSKQSEAQELLGQLNTKKSELEDLRLGAREEEIAEEQTIIDQLNVELANIYNNKAQRNELEQTLARNNVSLQNAQFESTRKHRLVTEGLIPSADVDTADTTLKLAQQDVKTVDAQIRALDEKTENAAAGKKAEIRSAESHLKTMKAGNRPELIRQAEEDVKRLEGQLDLYAREQKKIEIVADIDGVVATPYVERFKLVHLDAGQELMQLVDTSSVIAEMLVSEVDYEDIQKGYPVRLNVFAFPWRVFPSTIDSIATVIRTVDGQPMVPMYAILDNRDGSLKPDLTGYAKIYSGDRRIIDVMTYRFRRWFSRESWKLSP